MQTLGHTEELIGLNRGMVIELHLFPNPQIFQCYGKKFCQLSFGNVSLNIPQQNITQEWDAILDKQAFVASV